MVNAYNIDARIPKLAEEALYAHILYSILSTRVGIQEYVVRRFKQERSAKLRNAKIRLSNLKLDQVIQVMRGKSKWIK
jgi:RNA-binding protein YlmH